MNDINGERISFMLNVNDVADSNFIKCIVMPNAIKQAKSTMRENIGGPFGAAIIKDGKVIAYASNSVLGDKDPTAHAEINAIRLACRVLDTHDLTGCELYATSYPCPMCMAAIVWANIKKIYVSADSKVAEDAGFRDQFIYEWFSGVNEEKLVHIVKVDDEPVKEMFKEYKETNKQIY